MKYDIDSTSLSFFESNINNIKDADPARVAVNRMVIWFYMNEMVRDGKRKLIPYQNIILNNLRGESEDFIYDFQLNFLDEATSTYLPRVYRSDARNTIFDFVLNELSNLASR